MQFSQEQLNNVFMQKYLFKCLASASDLNAELEDLRPFYTKEKFIILEAFNSRVQEFNKLSNLDAGDELNPQEREIVASYDRLIAEPTGLPAAYRKKMYSNLLWCIDKHGLGNHYYCEVLDRQVQLMNNDNELNLAAKQLIFHNKRRDADFLAFMQKIYFKMQHKERFAYRDMIGLPDTRHIANNTRKNVDNPKNWSKEERYSRLEVILQIYKKNLDVDDKIALLEEGLKTAENNGNSRTYNFVAKRNFCSELRDKYLDIYEFDLADKYHLEAEKWQRSIVQAMDFAARKGYKDLDR